MAKTQIRLNETQLREFVSYSVARILREMKYGSDVIELEFDPENDENMRDAYESVLEEPEFQHINPEELDGVWPVNVKAWYTTERGEGGDRGEMVDSAEIDDFNWDDSTVPEELHEFVDAVIRNFFEGGYFSEDDILDYNSVNNGLFEGDGHKMPQLLTHFGKKEMDSAAERLHRNPDKDLTWDEYKEKRRKEAEDDRAKLSDTDRDMFSDLWQ